MGRIHRAPPCFTAIDPQNPPKTLRFRSNFKVFVCLTVCNHARTTLSRTGRSSPYIPRIPSHPPGTLLTQKSTPHVLQNTCGVHIYSLITTAGAPCRWYRQPPVWVHVGSFARGEPQPPAGLATRRATGRPPPSRHSPAHQCPQCGCAPSDPASTTDADTATGQPPPGYQSPRGRPAPGS